MSDPFHQRDWIKLEETQQHSAAKAFLRAGCMVLGLQEDVELIGVKDNDRFILAYNQDPEKPEFSRNMIKLETLMRQTMGVVVDLRLEAKADKNKRTTRTGREDLAARQK